MTDRRPPNADSGARLFKPAPSHNPLQAPAVCLCVECCKVVAALRCTAVSRDGHRCGDYKHRGKTHSLIVATVFQIVDERLSPSDGKEP